VVAVYQGRADGDVDPFPEVVVSSDHVNGLMMLFPRKFLVIVLVGFFLLWIIPILCVPPLISYLTIEPTLQRGEALVLMAGNWRERLPTLIRLYREERAPIILLANDGNLSAWSPMHRRNLYEVEWAKLELLKQEIPAEAIIILPFSLSGTYYDAQHVMDFARDKGLRSLLVVTSGYHTRRTLWSFQRLAGDESIKLGIYPVVTEQLSKISYVRFWILLEEMLKNLYYRWVF